MWYEALEVKWSEVAQLCPTLCDPMDYNLPGSSVYGILQARMLEWAAISFSRSNETLMKPLMKPLEDIYINNKKKGFQ